MALACFEARLQTMQTIFGISQTYGRPDLVTKNHRIKNFTERSFLIEQKCIFLHEKTEDGNKDFLNRNIFSLNTNIFS